MKKANNRYDIQDPLCILIACQPEIITEYVERPCTVILEGEGRGMISVKWLEKNVKGKINLNINKIV